MAELILKNNNTINFLGNNIGTYTKHDIWAENHCKNGRDYSGNKLVHFMYSFELIDGTKCRYACYTMTELREMLKDITFKRFESIMEAVKRANKW